MDIICPRCPPDDNEWDKEEFTSVGICKACFAAEYPERLAVCSQCHKGMRTRGKGEATCTGCRGIRQKRPEACACGTTSGKFNKGQCIRCYRRHWARAYRERIKNET